VPPDSTEIHVQPEPKRVAPAWLTFCFTSSKLPSLASASASRPAGGAPPPFGPMICQNSEWLAWPPPLLRTAVRMSSGTAFRLLISSSTLLFCRSGYFSSAAFRLLT
jgi:hypothetical protein